MPSDLSFHAPLILVSTTAHCWKCGAPTRVFGLEASGVSDPAVPPEGQDDLDGPLLLQHVEALPDRISQELSAAEPTFFLDRSRTLQADVWINHCEACGVRIGDTYLQSSGPLNALWAHTWQRRELVGSGSYAFVGGYRL